MSVARKVDSAALNGLKIDSSVEGDMKVATRPETSNLGHYKSNFGHSIDKIIPIPPSPVAQKPQYWYNAEN
jgi:hypothetical protein